jgi:NTE family protein
MSAFSTWEDSVNYHFKNLVFEGGGVKGIAYIGALEVLLERNVLPQIQRFGGTSAGAINAALLALGYSQSEQTQILKGMNFNNFMDNDWGYLRDAFRLIREFGWYKGDYFHQWIGELVARKLGHPQATFEDLKRAGKPELHVIGTNLSTGFSEVFSVEKTPHVQIAQALRISMSIPLFFRAIRGTNQNLYVDGGVFDNYPVKLFDRESYISKEQRPSHGRPTEYYQNLNTNLPTAASNPYIYNRETLGFRLDSQTEIKVFRDGQPPVSNPINDFVGFMKALMGAMIDNQASQHLHSDDWHRTIYIDTLGVSTTQFDLSNETKEQLVESGRKFTRSYFDWFDKTGTEPVNKPAAAAARRVS